MDQLARATSSSRCCTKKCCRPFSRFSRLFSSRKLTGAQLYDRLAPTNEISKDLPREALYSESVRLDNDNFVNQDDIADDEADMTSYLDDSKLFIDTNVVHPWSFPSICVQTAQARPPAARIVGMPFPPQFGTVVNCDVRRLEYVMSLQPQEGDGDVDHEFEISNVPDHRQIPGVLEC
eukprot:TRINITY_DN1162_c0_g1_i1.p1 TRINITY_DN1162_c0_g1~~TRINITY_DN1162_c0_g1_i1.p1  ORF type:complete len:178 (+),score=32.06 TRINITY_DN1162_c0_g1_i1:505-1038(+)